MTPLSPWRAPHLPLFLVAAAWAALVPLVWLRPDLSCDPVAWHRQELILGFAGAAMGGYLLTALPHWQKLAGAERGGIGAGGTRLLLAAWALGRLAGGSCVPDGLALAGLAAYPVGLTLALLVPVMRLRVWLRLPVALSPLLLLLAAVRLRLFDDSLTAVLGMALLVALIGGRILPAFLAARQALRRPRQPLPRAARLADAALALALAAHLSAAGSAAVGTLMLAAAAGQAARMWYWDIGVARRGHLDLCLLLMGWSWLPLGLALVGLALSGTIDLPTGTAVHALTLGMMGSMILAVMARGWMRREPGRLVAGLSTLAAFGLLQLSAVLRLGAAEEAQLAAVAAWSGGWAIAAAHGAAAIRRPVPHPILSASRAG